jgi:hypothetical protein
MKTAAVNSYITRNYALVQHDFASGELTRYVQIATE